MTLGEGLIGIVLASCNAKCSGELPSQLLQRAQVHAASLEISESGVRPVEMPRLNIEDGQHYGTGIVFIINWHP